MHQPTKVVLIDDHVILRECLKQMLMTEANIKVVGEAGNGRDGQLVVSQKKPDIVILDVSMPEMGGLEIISSLRVLSPESKIIILSMHSKEALAQEALRLGASAYILKGDNCEELIAAIQSVKNGDYYLSPQLMTALVSSYIGQPKPPDSEMELNYRSLSGREQQFFRLMLTGNPTVQISQELGISNKTGQKYRTSIVKKLGTENLLEMIKLAVKLGLFDPQYFEKS